MTKSVKVLVSKNFNNNSFIVKINSYPLTKNGAIDNRKSTIVLSTNEICELLKTIDNGYYMDVIHMNFADYETGLPFYAYDNGFYLLLNSLGSYSTFLSDECKTLTDVEKEDYTIRLKNLLRITEEEVQNLKNQAFFLLNDNGTICYNQTKFLYHHKQVLEITELIEKIKKYNSSTFDLENQLCENKKMRDVFEERIKFSKERTFNFFKSFVDSQKDRYAKEAKNIIEKFFV